MRAIQYAQNLVPNPGFEEHNDFIAFDSCRNRELEMAKPWKTTGWTSVWYWNTNIRRLSCKWGGNYTRTTPHSGKGMAELSYCDCCPDHTGPGCAAYIKTKLVKPLEVGKVYELSWWVYLPDNKLLEENLTNQIGAFLGLDPFIMLPHQISKDIFFNNMNPKLDQWFQVKNYVRALCPLEHIAFGLFRVNRKPSIFCKLGNHNTSPLNCAYFYGIDDVSITEVTDTSLLKDIQSTPFCKYYEEEKRKNELDEEKRINVYFDLNSSAITTKAAREIDDLFSLDTSNKKVYYIRGMTDKTGGFLLNKDLAYDRVESTKKYILSKYPIQDYQFILVGQDSTVWSDKINESEIDPKQRKIEIIRTSLDYLSAIYYYGIQKIYTQEFAEATKYFIRWINIAPDEMKMYILFDPRLDMLKKAPQWNFILNALKKIYERDYVSRESFYLDSLVLEDQKFRGLDWQLAPPLAFIRRKDVNSLKAFEIDSLNFAIHDSLVLKSFLKFMNAKEMPTRAQYGKRASLGTVAILIHSMDTLLYKKYLPLIYKNCMKGEMTWESYFTMYDRNLKIKNLPQEYGTQYIRKNKKWVLYDYDDLIKVNERRIKYGMGKVEIEIE